MILESHVKRGDENYQRRTVVVAGRCTIEGRMQNDIVLSATPSDPLVHHVVQRVVHGPPVPEPHLHAHHFPRRFEVRPVHRENPVPDRIDRIHDLPKEVRQRVSIGKQLLQCGPEGGHGEQVGQEVEAS
ncbi:hypothetical protein Mapa_007511 [Marchantia paleacea]|nr:hypothetical protein Mapa_007511 [Marchantia paleacea]